MQRLNGKAWWISPDTEDDAPILNALFADDRIAFDVTASDLDYTVTLAPAAAGPPWWKGTWRCRTDRRQGHAAGRLYSSVDGGIALFGQWHEDDVFSWIVELRP